MAQAIGIIDDTAPRSPTGYAVNCVHPTSFYDGLAVLEAHDPALTNRILSYQATELMLRAFQRYGTPFLGGCCGTDTSHIECLASVYNASLH